MLIISAPFGNYFRSPKAVSTLGTFTLRPRGTVWTRLWKLLTTLRYSWSEQSWYNNLGLPNPGIGVLSEVPRNCIVSVHGMAAVEWEVLLECLEKLGAPPVELNLSCPNVKKAQLPVSLKYSGRVIAKLPPVGYDSLLYGCLILGIDCFHLCNTLPSTRGGRSGKVLKPYSLRAVEGVRHRFGDELEIIGGGGVTSVEDVGEFIRAGADHVAVGSMLLNPLNWHRVSQMVRYLETLPPENFPGGGNFAKPQKWKF